MYDILRAVVPTKLWLEEFYEEYSGLWRHVVEARFRHRGRARTCIQLAGALATGRVCWGSVRRGMNIAQVFSRPGTFLEAHRREPLAASSV